MELIAAVYDNWGLGAGGTQPVVLKADRKFFRETTRGATVIVGRKTAADFPDGKPLPKRTNILLTRGGGTYPGFLVSASPEEAAALCAKEARTFVIGGGSVYKAMLPMCGTARITKIHCAPDCDTFLPDLDADPAWELTETLQRGEEDGIAYEMCLYRRIGKENAL